ncbi:putative mrna splicing factor rna helicase protein [Erysiphe neolycopersici]|uniref:Putative mrna splicing factor rna helicase protein n=1 Tax=Erysiphe neolycopersici TaxID=212602 RepID=A0A420I2L6_9PEZI|nr:putative mrna splicing factor rna helicase protein [Erysiphe neolycopersici]
MQDTLSSTNPCFRATKKRRTAYRQRLFFSENKKNDIDENHESVGTGMDLALSLPNIIELDNVYLGPTADTQPLITADVVRKRLRYRRTGGVEFKTEVQSTRKKEERSEEAEDPEEESPGGPQDIKNKLRIFTRQTGVIGDADRHMMAYVDSELAKRSSQGLQASADIQKTTQQQPTASKHVNIPHIPGSSDHKLNDISKVKATIAPRQPVMLGMLQEIDLGDEARERNVKMTEQATRRLDGEVIEDEQETGKHRRRGGKTMPGKDGKSWWERKRRRGDDIKRDQLVDQVLRENRLEIYEEPHVPFQVTQTDQAADDRIAEAFRREFMDNASSRQRKKNNASQVSARGQSGKKDEALKGPKLGGSRSARAAVRENLLKSAKK